MWKPFYARKTVTGVEARQGFLDRPVLAVLIVSTALVVMVFGAMLLGTNLLGAW